MSARLGPLLFLAIIVLDQLTKALMVTFLPADGSVVLTPFFNLVLVHNTGISFGVFRAAPGWGRWVLVLLTLAIGLALILWLRREARLVPRLAIWAILAGAVGNLIDRLRLGAVVDFLDFHLGGYHWPAFNVADSMIVLGAALLVIDGLLLQRAPLDKVE